MDILVKTESLKTLEHNLNHAEAFEMVMPDQNKMSYISDVAVLQMSTYCKQKWAKNTGQIMNNNDACFITTQNCDDNVTGM